MAILKQHPQGRLRAPDEAAEVRCRQRGEQLQHGHRTSCTSPRCFATPGPILKRMMPRAQGRAYRINKRTSHVTLGVTEKE